MNDYTIIEDIFGDEDRNQVTAARGFVGNSHIPEDLKPKRAPRRSERPDIPDLTEPQDRMGMLSNPGVYPPGYVNIPPRNVGIQIQENPPSFIPPQHPMLMSYQDHLQCRDVFTHVENCPICSSYFKKDVKFYWLIIAILVVVILLLTRTGK